MPFHYPLYKLILPLLLPAFFLLPQTATAQTGQLALQTAKGAATAKPYSLVEQMPQFDGGKQELTKFMATNIRYPREAIRKGIHGTIHVTFIIQPDGTLTDAEVLQKLGHGIEEEALRVVNLMNGRWLPGKQDGKPAAVRFTQAIKFTLLDDGLQGINQPLTDSLNNFRPFKDPATKRFMQQEPRFTGGRDALHKFVGDNLNYPASAKAGKLIVSFILDEKGAVSHASIKQGITPELDAEAVRVVSLMSGKWEPGIHEGKPIKVGYYLPITIKQTGGKPALPPADNTVYVAADQMPDYIAGAEQFYKTLNSQLLLPKEIRNKNLNARLEVQFVVEKDGTLSDIRITDTKYIKTIGPETEFNYMDASRTGLVNKEQQAQLSAATLAAVKATSGQWTPGIRNGQEVRVQVNLPISLKGDAKAVAAQPAMKTVTILKPATSTRPAASSNNPEEKIRFSHQVFYTGDNRRASFGDGSPSAYYRFLTEQVRYPEGTDAQGIVKASFRITTDGSLDNITVAPGTDPVLEKEIVRVINLMNGAWKPGESNGKPFPTTNHISFNFEIQDKNARSRPDPRNGIPVVKYR